MPDDVEDTCPQCAGHGEYCVEIEDWRSDGREPYATVYRYKTLAQKTCHHPWHGPDEPVYDEAC